MAENNELIVPPTPGQDDPDTWWPVAMAEDSKYRDPQDGLGRQMQQEIIDVNPALDLLLTKRRSLHHLLGSRPRSLQRRRCRR